MVRSSPTVIDRRVIFGDDEGTVHALDTKTGKLVWKFTTDGQVISSVNHSGSRLVLGSYDGFVYCLDLSSGKLNWKFETEGRVHGTPGISGKNVLVAGCDEFLHVLNLENGQSVRRIAMGSVSGCSPAVDGDRAAA